MFSVTFSRRFVELIFEEFKVRHCFNLSGVKQNAKKILYLWKHRRWKCRVYIYGVYCSYITSSCFFIFKSLFRKFDYPISLDVLIK